MSGRLTLQCTMSNILSTCLKNNDIIIQDSICVFTFTIFIVNCWQKEKRKYKNKLFFYSTGITFPSGKGQHALLDAIYTRSGINPSSVSYVEAHGTGTKAGDPQEVNTITKVYCCERSQPLLLGSVKSNIGHTEATAGRQYIYFYWRNICSQITQCP